MPLDEVTRTSVLQAIEEYDELGRTQFLNKYGFGKAKTTWLIHRGNSYDSKAVIGVARGYARADLGPLAWNEFFGGNPVCNRLSSLSFTVKKERGNAPFPPPQIVSPDAAGDELFDPRNVLDARERIKTTITQRRGQRAFRDALIAAYGGRCPITGVSTLHTLEAAHIFPYLGPATNATSNGLLLRADLHTLFDCKLLAIHPQTDKVRVAPSIKDKEYRDLHGRCIELPKREKDRPNKKALRRHLSECKQLWRTR